MLNQDYTLSPFSALLPASADKKLYLHARSFARFYTQTIEQGHIAL